MMLLTDGMLSFTGVFRDLDLARAALENRSVDPLVERMDQLARDCASLMLKPTAEPSRNSPPPLECHRMNCLKRSAPRTRKL